MPMVIRLRVRNPEMRLPRRFREPRDGSAETLPILERLYQN